MNSQVPRHLAIIMDGNGRWARSRKHSRIYGHTKGARRAREIIEECSRCGVEFLTLFAFSTENWLRPKSEVNFLMKLLIRQLYREQKTLIKNNIQFKCIGDQERLSPEVRKAISDTCDLTEKNDGMTLVFALSYGGQQEISSAVRKIAENVENNNIRPQDIDIDLIQQSMPSAFLPEVDLLIRTSGEYRISNFLLWHLAYSEFHFSKTLWPDFRTSDLHAAFKDYNQRERRFGQTSEQLPHVTP